MSNKHTSYSLILLAVTGLVGIVRRVVPKYAKVSLRNVYGSLEKSNSRLLVDNDEKRSRLIAIRGAGERIVGARDNSRKDVIPFGVFGNMVKYISGKHGQRDFLHASATPFEWLVWKYNSVEILIRGLLRRGITKPLLFIKERIFEFIRPSRQEQFKVCCDEGERMADISQGYFDLKSGLFIPLRKGPISEALKTEGRNQRIVAESFKIYEFYPRPFRQFKLFLGRIIFGAHFPELSQKQFGGDDADEYQQSREDDSPPFRTPKPFWGYCLLIVGACTSVASTLNIWLGPKNNRKLDMLWWLSRTVVLVILSVFVISHAIDLIVGF
jgi:hypothetical protein